MSSDAPWYRTWFNADYPYVYPHRTAEDAEKMLVIARRYLTDLESSRLCDCCCGLGRLSFVLAETGADVTGFDLSRYFIDANQRANTWPNLTFVVNDIREMPWHHEFDAVFQLFTSFGYFDSKAENLSVFDEVYRALKNDGYYFFDFLNPSHVRKNLVPESTREQDGMTIIEKRRIDGDVVWKDIEIRSDGSPREYHERVMLLEPNELKAAAAKVGFTLIDQFGSYDADLFDPLQSERFIAVFQK